MRALGATYHSCSVAEVGFEPDVILECTGVGQVISESLLKIGASGVVCLTGVGHGGTIPKVTTADVASSAVLKNNVVFGSVNASRANFEAAVRSLGDFVHLWPEAVRGLLTGRFPIEEAPRLLTGRASGIKEVVVVGGRP